MPIDRGSEENRLVRLQGETRQLLKELVGQLVVELGLEEHHVWAEVVYQGTCEHRVTSSEARVRERAAKGV